MDASRGDAVMRLQEGVEANLAFNRPCGLIRLQL